MKLLFVLEHYHPYIGGAETLFINLCEALVQNGFEVRVVTTRYRSDLPVAEVHGGVQIKRIDCHNRFLFSAFALPAVFRLAGWADLVHTTTYNAALPAWVGARLRRKTVIITFHEYWGKLWFQLPFLSWPAARLFYAYERLIMALPYDRYVAVSDYTALSLVQGGVEKRKVERIYNGLDYTRYREDSYPASGRFTYTYFGRLGVSKGLDLIIPAAAKFREIYPDSQLRLILPRRPKEMFDRIMGLVDQHGLHDYVDLRHELSEAELRVAVQSSDCVLITSYSEGFCFVAAETAAAGVPIISSGRGALPETVSGQHLVMPAMTVEALVDCLQRASVGDWVNAPVKRFPLKDSVDAYLAFYQGLITDSL